MKAAPFSSIALLALSATRPASAADMPLKAPTLPPPVPIYSWTGFYVGGNAGYSWGKEDLRASGFFVDGIAVPSAAFAALRPSGPIGGGQVGFNWQTSNLVFGVEADFQGSDQKESIFGTGA